MATVQCEAVISYHSLRCPECKQVMMNEGDTVFCGRRGCEAHDERYRVITPVIELRLERVEKS